MPKYASQQVAHMWANGNVESATNHADSFYFRGRTLYSYGTHYVVGLRLPGGHFAINGDSSTNTTAKHKSYAGRAVNWNYYTLPDLTAIAGTLESAAWGEAPGGVDLRPTVERYLRNNWQALEPDAGAYLFRLAFPGSRGTWAAMRARLEREAKRKADKAKAAGAAASARLAADSLLVPFKIDRARAMRGAADYMNRGLREAVSLAWQLHRDCPKRNVRQKAALWRRYKALKAGLDRAERADGRASRQSQWGGRTTSPRNEVRAALAKLRRLKAGDVGHVPGFDGPAITPERTAAALAYRPAVVWRALADNLRDLLRHYFPATPAIREAVNALAIRAQAEATAAETAEQRAEKFKRARSAIVRELRILNETRRDMAGNWQESPAETQNAMRYRSRALTEAAGAAESLLRYARGERDNPGQESLCARLAPFTERLESFRAEALAMRAPLLEQWERARDEALARERAERARIDAMTPEQKADAWRAGELAGHHLYEVPGGPFLRATGAEIDGCEVKGGTLETSQGASVPLRHAFRVFQFIAACRAAGRTWRSKESGWTAAVRGTGKAEPWGPARIRVGAFQVDHVEPSGNFKAGCHYIKWPEVARLAESLGVADCLAEPETISGELETAA